MEEKLADGFAAEIYLFSLMNVVNPGVKVGQMGHGGNNICYVSCPQPGFHFIYLFIELESVE